MPGPVKTCGYLKIFNNPRLATFEAILEQGLPISVYLAPPYKHWIDMEYEKIIAVTGLPGLFELVSSKSDGAIVRSLDDKSTRFVSSRIHNFSHLESIEVYTVRENVNLTELFTAMDGSGEKLPDGKDNKLLKKYFETVYPDIDFERVYTSDMKKMVKWYTILKENGVEIKLREEPVEEEAEVEEEKPAEQPAAEKKSAKSAPKQEEKPAKKEKEDKAPAKKEAKPAAKKAAPKKDSPKTEKKEAPVKKTATKAKSATKKAAPKKGK